MLIRTVAGRVAPILGPGQSAFEYCFESVFGELRDCWFVVDEWRPENFPAEMRDLLGRYRMAGVDVGRRVVDVYRGKRFLPTFAFGVPAGFGRVFAFAGRPDEGAVRSSTDGYAIYADRLAPATVASFVSSEGTWTFATSEARWMEVLRAGLPAGLELIETPPSLNFLERG
jgi:hypothetical protein